MPRSHRVLILHNRHKLRGGEDVCVEAQQKLLGSRGHQVSLVIADNDEINSAFDRMTTAAGFVYSHKWKKRVADEINAFSPDIVHVHNTFPLLSASVLDSAANAEIPVVHTLHNYRYSCLNGLLNKDGKICERCVGKTFAWEGIKHQCYRGSTAGSLAVAAGSMFHRWSGAYEKVDAFVVLSEFARSKFVEMGLRAKKLSIIPNFLNLDPGPGNGSGSYFLYVGRLSEEKGVRVLLNAWRCLNEGPELRIIGKGPLESEVVDAARANSNVRWLGFQESSQVLQAMRHATAVVVPSVCYEGCPLSVIESFAAGTPVIASELGSMASLCKGDAASGFEAGNPGALAEAVIRHASSNLKSMRAAARAEFEKNYTADAAYAKLTGLYQQVIDSKSTFSFEGNALQSSWA